MPALLARHVGANGGVQPVGVNAQTCELTGFGIGYGKFAIPNAEGWQIPRHPRKKSGASSPHIATARILAQSKRR